MGQEITINIPLRCLTNSKPSSSFINKNPTYFQVLFRNYFTHNILKASDKQIFQALNSYTFTS